MSQKIGDIDDILSKNIQLSEIQGKIFGGLVGAMVGDAATRPLHWIYRPAELEIILEDGLEEGIEQPEFWPVSKSPFYTLPTGARSCYNEIVMAGMAACIKSGGKVDLGVYSDVLHQKFGEGTEWQESLKMRKQQYDCKRRAEWREPVPGPWLHESIINYLKNGDGDPENKDTDGFLLSVGHILWNYNRPTVIDEALQISRMFTKHPATLEYIKIQITIIISLLKNKAGLEDCLKDQSSNEIISQVLNQKDTEHKVMSKSVGNNCYLPGSLQGALHAAITTSSFPDAIRRCIEAGGCNCSRANYIGLILGISSGVDIIPRDWLTKTHDVVELAQSALDFSNMVAP